MYTIPQILETERMYLVRPHEKYIEEIFHEFDEEITKYMGPIPSKELQETRNRCLGAIRKMQNKERINLLWIEKDTGAFVGSFDIFGFWNTQLEGGLRIKKSSHGKWYGREGMLALIQRVKENIEFGYILYPVDKDNLSSRKIAELAGGILDVDEDGKEIVTKKTTQDPNRFLNTVHYRIYKHAK